MSNGDDTNLVTSNFYASSAILKTECFHYKRVGVLCMYSEKFKKEGWIAFIKVAK